MKEVRYMFYIDVDKKLPPNRKFVKGKVADFMKDYKTIAFYDNKSDSWYSINCLSLNDNVFCLEKYFAFCM